MANQLLLKKSLRSPATPCFTVATMTPAPPNNPGHQEAQGRPSEVTTQRPPRECAGDSLNAETVLNALDVLLKASRPDSKIIVCLDDRDERLALFCLGSEPNWLAGGRTVLEALQNLVR